MTSTEPAEELYAQVEAYVQQAFAGHARKIRHLERTVHWLTVLRPHPAPALRVAALAHDIEHSEEGGRRQQSGADFIDPEALRWHQDRGGEMMAAFLAKQGAPPALCNEVKELISHHEEGGTADADLLMDADSLSFLEIQVNGFIKRVGADGYDNVRRKFDYMFDRIAGDQARELARPLYQAALEKLEASRPQRSAAS